MTIVGVFEERTEKKATNNLTVSILKDDGPRIGI
jgi:hypothetical protein